ncbi:ankyrin repeat and SAM domain-containing protein 3-like isoform X1 [Styela clava]
MAVQGIDNFEESGIFHQSLSIWKGICHSADGTFVYEDDNFDPISLDLHTSASIGETELVQDILDRKQVKVNGLNRGGWSPLMYAAYMGHQETINLLVETGADINQRTPQGSTSLILAAMCGYDAVMPFLLQNGADLEAKDNRGWTALFHAASSGHQQTTEFLIKAGANLEVVEPNHHLTPIMEAAASGHEMIVQQLLQQGVDVNRVDINGENAQTLACEYGHIEVANLIENFEGYQKKSKGKKTNRNNLNNTAYQRQSNANNNNYSSSGPSIHDGPKAFAQMTGLGADGKPKPSGEFPLFLPEPSPQQQRIQEPKFESKWTGCKDLPSFLEEIGCSKHLPIFKEQDIDLRIFLTLTEAELKEIGVKLFGPRRKMVAAIARVNSSIQASLIDRTEVAYCDSLLFRIKDMETKLKECQETVTDLSAQLAQERQLRSVAESVLMEQKESKSSMHRCTDKIIVEHGNLIRIADQIRSYYAKSNLSKGRHQSNTNTQISNYRTVDQEYPKLSQEFDMALHHSRACLLEMQRVLQVHGSNSIPTGKGDIQWKERG